MRRESFKSGGAADALFYVEVALCDIRSYFHFLCGVSGAGKTFSGFCLWYSHEILKIALIGAFSSGKSAVLEFFAEAGYKTFSADKTAHYLMRKDAVVREKIISKFGKSVTFKDGRISRKKLGKTVFADEKKMRVLESILHPAIKRNLLKKMKGLGKAAVENPLLFRMKMAGFVDKIVLVKSDFSKIEKNIAKRGIAAPRAELILSYQRRNLKYPRRPHFIILNTGDLRRLRKDTRDVIKALENERRNV